MIDSGWLQRMRQEDRLGMVVSQLEQNRMVAELERRALQSQLQLLADEVRHDLDINQLTSGQLSYERRRSLAQLCIILTIIVLGVATRSSTINAVLKPLVGEARHRGSVYTRHSRHGPLANSRIDLSNEPPAAFIGPERPSPSLLDFSKFPRIRQLESSSSAALNPRGAIKNNSTSVTARRSAPGTTPRQIRQSSLVIPTYRAASASDQGAPHVQIGSNGTSPRPRTFMTPPRVGNLIPSRRLARSAHLHTVEAEYARDRTRNEDLQEMTANFDTRENVPRKYLGDMNSKHRLFAHSITVSPLNDARSKLASDALNHQLVANLGDEEHEDWGTDADTDASTSEVDADLYAGVGKDDRHAKIFLDQASVKK